LRPPSSVEPARSRRPPLWLAAAALAAGLSTLYGSFVWINSFLVGPIHVDVRLNYVAAQAGLRYGWSTIYDQSVLRALSSGFPPHAQFIDSQTTYASLPLLAWLFAPLTYFPEPVAYAVWTALSLLGLVLAWWICAPFSGLAKLTLLLVALSLWPVELTFDLGQPTPIVMAAVAAAFWLCKKDRALAAGTALALATFLKPQAVLLLPLALLVSGRGKVVVSWLATALLLGVLSIATLGESGLQAWWHATRTIAVLPVNTEYTLAHILGANAATYALWGVQAAAALYIAWRRRNEIEIVIAVGVLGSVATASYFHEADYGVLLLPAWLFLRTSPPLWQRLYLLAGIVPMQLMTYWAGPQDLVWTLVTRGSQLAWDAGWLGILVYTCLWQGRSSGRSPVDPEIELRETELARINPEFTYR
jgi:Glycosyltransferase family 87